MQPQPPPYDPPALDAFVALAGPRLWAARMAEIGRYAACGPRAGQAIRQRHALELAIERLRAFDQARSRLSWDQQKALAADQNRWGASLAETCDLDSDEPPSLPLDASAKDCLVREGRSRLAFLQAYGAATAGPNPAPTTTVAIRPAATATPATQPPQPQPASAAPRTTPSQLVAGAAPPWAQTDSGTIGSQPPRR